jgi:23S rRNA (cytosine1962-C5)-methyltransferase
VSPLTPYELIDFGDGRKLERFGRVRIDRPCPAALDVARNAPAAWATADARYERSGGADGQWVIGHGVPDVWSIHLGGLRLELRATPSGQLGLFPEQVDNWRWLARQLGGSRQADSQAAVSPDRGQYGRSRPVVEAAFARSSSGGAERIRILNLFAYTGGSTLAAAAAGAAVVHVDASRSAVSWARHNARLSGLDHAPVRWIVEDAVRFVRREVRRGNRYDGIVLDPPTYGHGPKGEAWKIERHLHDLLCQCAQLVRGDRPLLLLTCHTPGLDGAALRQMLGECFRRCAAERIRDRSLHLSTQDGRQLASGAMVRCGFSI